MRRRFLFFVLLLFPLLLAAEAEWDDEEVLPAIERPPASLPEVRLYSAESPFRQRLPLDAPIDTNSERYVRAIAEEANETNGLMLSWRQYSTTVFFADSTTPRHDVTLTCGSAWGLGVRRLKNVPIPDFARPSLDTDGSDNPVVPGECGEEADQDNHMVIIDLDGRYEYDFWQAYRRGDRWFASWANALSIDGPGVFEKGLSARGAGFAFLAGVIWPNELRRGRIEHALALVLAPDLVRSGGPVPPATESDGPSDLPEALPEGARLRLDPSLDLDALDLTPVERTIARAMQEYGLVLAEVGGLGVGIQAIDPRSARENPYEGILPDEDYPTFPGIPLERLQVLKLPPQDIDFQDKIGLPDGGGAQFE